MMRSTTLLGLALSSCLSLGVAACQTDNGAPDPQLETQSDTRAGPSLSPGFPTDSTNPHLGYGLGVYVGESEHGLTSDESQMGRHLPKPAAVVLEALADTGR